MPWKRRDIKNYLDSIADVLSHPASLDSVDPDEFDLVFYRAVTARWNISPTTRPQANC